MKQLLALLFFIPSLCLAQSVTLPYNPDANADSTIGAPDLLEFLPLFGEPFSPSSILIDGMALNQYITMLESVSDTLSGDSTLMPMISGTTPGELLIWDGTSWTLLQPGDELQSLVIQNGIPTWTGLVAGCTDPNACNYESTNTVSLPGACTYPDECGICGGPGAVYECGCEELPEGACDCDGGEVCSSPITFHVDVSNLELTDGDVIYLTGSFDGWCGGCHPMEDEDGDGVWTTTIYLWNGIQEYKFNLNAWADQEYLSSDEACTMTTDIYVNRYIEVQGEPMTLDTVCWGSCATCAELDSIPDTEWTCAPIEHEGHVYDVIELLDQCWLAENLRTLPEVFPPSDTSSFDPRHYVLDYDGYSIAEAEATSQHQQYGTLYNFPAASSESTCPSGWRLPTNEDWMALMSSWSPSQLSDVQGWPNTGMGSDYSGFSAISAGLLTDEGFYPASDLAYWWSSTPTDNAGYAHAFSIANAQSATLNADMPLSAGISIRCVKDLGCDLQSWFPDVDGDGLGEPNSEVQACTGPDGHVNSADDLCFDLNAINFDDPANVPCEYVDNCSPSVSWNGHEYGVVSIGGRCWFNENLRTATYANGDTIPAASQDAISDSGAQINPDEDSDAYLDEYGRLYNGFAVLDDRNLCPTGWQVPSDADFLQLEHVLGAPWEDLNQEPMWSLDIGESANVGGQLKTTGTVENGDGLWLDPNLGAVNSSGFNAKPAGWHGGTITGGELMALGQNGSFWTTTRHSLAPLLLIDHAVTSATQGVKRIADPPEQYYFSVRCIQCPNGLCLGCTDANACNYDATAMEDDGSCEFASCSGCTDPQACNYDPLATQDDGTCDVVSCAGCVDPMACNYDPFATQGDASCEFTTCAGCMSQSACNFDPDALLPDASACEFPDFGVDCDGNCLPQFLTPDGTCEPDSNCAGTTFNSNLIFPELAGGEFAEITFTASGFPSELNITSEWIESGSSWPGDMALGLTDPTGLTWAVYGYNLGVTSIGLDPFQEEQWPGGEWNSGVTGNYSAAFDNLSLGSETSGTWTLTILNGWSTSGPITYNLTISLPGLCIQD